MGLLDILRGVADQADFIPGVDPNKDSRGLISQLLGMNKQPVNPSGMPPIVPKNAVQKRSAQAPGGAMPNPFQQFAKPRGAFSRLLTPNSYDRQYDVGHQNFLAEQSNRYTAQQARMAADREDQTFETNLAAMNLPPHVEAMYRMARNGGDSPFAKELSENIGFNTATEGSVYSQFGNSPTKVEKTFTPVDPAKLAIDQQNADSATLTAKAAMHRAKNPSPLVENTINGEQEPSIFQEKLDAAAADEYIAWTQGGGADAVKQLSQISEVMTRLESGEENLTGPLLGMVSPQFRALFNEGSVDAQQLVEEVVQRNLRLILGAQFTEKEGKMLIERAYNPQLEEPINAKRLGRLFTQMSTAAQQKQAQMRYLEQNGTLVGYAGTTPGMSDFFAALEEEDGGANSPDFTPQDDERLQYLEAKAAGQFNGTFEQWKSQRGSN